MRHGRLFELSNAAQVVGRLRIYSERRCDLCAKRTISSKSNGCSYLSTLLSHNLDPPAGISIAQMAFISAAPLYPDLSLCNAWYSGWQANLPNLADCRSAYDKLPSGATPVTFITHLYPSHTPPGVPLVIASG